MKGLLLKSRNRMLARRLAMAVLFVAVTGVAVTMYQLWQNADLRRQEALQATEDANLRRREALQATNTSIGRLAGFLNDGTIRAGGAEKFLEDAKVSLDQLAAIDNRSPDLSKIEISLLHGVSDVKDALGDYKQAFRPRYQRGNALAEIRQKISQHFGIQTTPLREQISCGRPACKKPNEENIEKAEHEYRDAVDLAKQLATSEPDNMKRQQQKGPFSNTNRTSRGQDCSPWVVDHIEAARSELLGRGVDASGVYGARACSC